MPVPARLPVVAAGAAAVAAAGIGVGVVLARGDDEPPPRRDATGCPVAVGYVAELLGYDMEVVEDGASTLACRYEPVDEREHPGSHVLIVERSVVDQEGYEAVRSGVEVSATSMTILDDEALDDLGERAERGWTAELGRVVQVGVGTVDALFQVTVADADRPAEEALEVALDLAADAIR